MNAPVTETPELNELVQTVAAALVDGVGSAIAVAVDGADGRRFRHVAGATTRWRKDSDGELIDALGPAVDATTRFDLASLTKPMATSTLVAQELSDDASAWSLDTPIGELLPDVAHGPTADRTVAQLLSHSSGLSAWHDFYKDTLDEADQPAAIRAAVCAAAPDRPAGVSAVYSDLGFLLLGWALEATTGTGLAQLFVERVAGPLGLRDTGYGPVDATNERAVCATEIWPPRCPDGRPIVGAVHDDNCAGLDGVAGHAGLFGTADDVAAWARSWRMTIEGTQSDELAVDPAVATAIVGLQGAPGTTWRGAFDTPSPPPAVSNAGSHAPAGTFGHLGFTGTSVWIAPHVGSVVLLTNRVHPSRDDAAGIRRLRPTVHDLAWRWLGCD